MSTTMLPNPIQPPPQEDPTSLLPKKLVRARPLFDPEIVRRATQASFVKLNPITLDEEPGDVCGRGGRGAYDGVPDPRHVHRRAPASASAFKSHCGSGLRCCLQTSPKPWRRRAEKLKPTACAKPRPM